MPWSSQPQRWSLQGAGSCWPGAMGTNNSILFPQAQVIAQAIGQAFGVAYQRFLEANSIDPSELSPRQYSHALEEQEQYNAELSHFSQQENCKDVRAALDGWDSVGYPVSPPPWLLRTPMLAHASHDW